MTDGTTLNPGTGGDVIATDDLATLNGGAVSGVKAQRVKVGFGADGDLRDVDDTHPLPITGTVTVSGVATAANQAAGNTALANILTALGSPLQSGEPVSISGTVPVSGPLTDAQLRAAAVPVSGTFWQAVQPVSGTVAVSGTVPVSAASLPLPTGAATAAGLTTINTTLGSPFQAGGSIGNTAFGISGTLPAFASTPTFNLGTIGAAATEATLASIVKAEDSPATSGDMGVVMLAMRYDADAATTSNDGDYAVPKLDEEGRLKVASKPASYAPTVGNITANGQAVFIPCSRFSNLMIHCKGTFSTVNVTFEGSLDSTNGSDGTWFTVQAVRSNANTIETATGNLSAAPAYAWELSVNALVYFRVRATAFTSGTQTWTFIPGTYATEPIPAAQISGTQPVSGTVSLGAGSTLAGFFGAAVPGAIADVASAALTTTTTTAAFTPNYGTSYEVNIPVTVVSGTNPTLDVVIQESDDSGTNWFDVWHFPRITATGIYRSPKIPLTGNRVRYVQTVGGTTPSFTRAINRLQSSDTAPPLRRIIDRSLNSAQALNATMPTLGVLSATTSLQLVITASTITTTAPAIQLQGSADGANWYNVGTPLTAVQSSTVQATVTGVNAEFVRGIVTTAGVSATLVSVAIKAF